MKTRKDWLRFEVHNALHYVKSTGNTHYLNELCDKYRIARIDPQLSDREIIAIILAAVLD